MHVELVVQLKVNIFINLLNYIYLILYGHEQFLVRACTCVEKTGKQFLSRRTEMRRDGQNNESTWYEFKTI